MRLAQFTDHMKKLKNTGIELSVNDNTKSS